MREHAGDKRPPPVVRGGLVHLFSGRAGVRQHLLTGGLPSAYADDMNQRVELTEGAASSDPEIGLRAVASLRTLTEQLEILQVDNARDLGWSWQEIAARLGVTKQTVHRKHGRRWRS